MGFALRSLTARSRLLVLASFTPLYALSMANWCHGWIRFGSPRLNYLFMTLVFASPLIPLWIAWTSESQVFKVAVSVLLIPVSLVSGVLLLGIMLRAAVWVPNVILSDVDYSFERLRQERVANELFGVYRTNGGATTSFGVVVRKERVIIPGLFKVRDVCSCYPADDVRLTRVNARTIRCEFPPYGTKRPNVKQIEVSDGAG